MNKENAKDYLPLVQALADGKVIEFKGRGGWCESADPSFDFPADQYRIKSEPEEILATRYRDGRVTQVRYREVIE